MDVIGIATTGGDAPGINAVRTAAANGLRVVGFERGYAGILANETRPLDARDLEYASTVEKPIDERLYKLALALAT